MQIRFNVPNKTPLVFHNGSNYHYHFIIKQLANKFWKIQKSTKCFSTPIEREVTKVDKEGNENITISFKLKFIDIAWFMACSLSNLVDSLAEGIHAIKSKDCDFFFLNVKESRTI